MSLRRRIALVFLGVNIFTLGGLVVYILVITRGFKTELESSEAVSRESTAHLLGVAFTHAVEHELRRSLSVNSRIDDSAVRRIISEQSYWDDDSFVATHLDKAVLVRYEENDDNANTALFNPRPRFIFENIADFKNIVRRAVKSTREVQTLGANIVVGRLNLPGERTWGFYFRLRTPRSVIVDPATEVRNVFLLTVPGMALLLAVLWFLFSSYVLKPISSMGEAAKRMSDGDFSKLVEIDDRSDEIGDLGRTLNTSMAQLEQYRLKMESMVAEATERFKKAERHLVLHQRLAAMGQLAAGIAHEINNPLGGVLNALRRLGDDETTAEKRKRFYEIARDAVQRIQEIVQRVLAAAPRKVEPEVVPLSKIVQQAVGLVHHRAQKSSIEIEVLVDPRTTILGTPNDLIQVFLNLFINACDAIGEKGKITVAARIEGDFVAASVEDTGAGMTEDVKEHIFDFFFTTKPGQMGTGLGLAIVHNIVSAHGGQIQVDSAPGQGATFTLTLPIGETKGP